MAEALPRVVLLAVLMGLHSGSRGETVSGDVTTADGKPAAGARVWLMKLSTQERDRREVDADEQGRFSIEVGPGRWIVNAVLDDQGLAEMDLYEVEAGRPAPPKTLHLAPQGRLRGRLIEAETGEPIKGGRFVIDDGRDPITDAEGRFEAPGLARTRSHEAFVVAPGRERKRVLFEMAEGPITNLDVFVPRGGKIVGRVLDLEGVPIAGAAVGRSTSGSILSLTGLWEHTDAQGAFEYDGLVLDRATWLNVEASGFTGADRQSSQLASGEEARPLVFRLARNQTAPQAGTAVRGDAPRPGSSRVRNVTGVVFGPDKKPVARAKVRWGPHEDSNTIETKTDAEGRFRLSPVSSESNVVWVVPEDGPLAPGVATAAAGGDQDVQIELEKGHTVSGVVQDDQGAPFAGVMVLPVVNGVGQRGAALWERKATTDDKGRFVVAGLPDQGARFTFLREGVSDLRDHDLELDKECVVVMSAAGAVRGKVIDFEGKPVRNFRVLLNISRERKPDDQYGSFFAGYCGIGLTYSSDDGSFLVRNLNAGSVQRVTVLAPGFGEATIDRVVAEPLSRLTPEKAVTFFVKKPHTLRVHITDEASGAPIGGAQVALMFEGPGVEDHFAWGYHDAAWGDSVHARSDDKGVADFTPLVFGEGVLVLRAPGHCRKAVGWRDGKADVTVKLAPEAVISGRLIDEKTGKPIEQANVSLTGQDGGQMSASVSAGDDGHFQIGELPAGEYTLGVGSASGASLHNERVVVDAGRQETLTIQVGAPKPAEPAAALGEKLIKVGQRAPEFTAKTLDDRPFALEDLRGKFVLLDFWATWCGPCIAEIPHLQAVHEAFGDDPKFAMVSLSLDAVKPDAVKFLKGKKQPWTQVFLGDWSSDEVTKQYGVELIPTILLLDPEGKVVARQLRGGAVKDAVAKALKRD